MSEQSAEMDRTCGEHGEPLVWERGGPDMPTIHGRWYCPSCQAALMAVLDGTPIPSGSGDPS